jgi:hypothetical protein
MLSQFNPTPTGVTCHSQHSCVLTAKLSLTGCVNDTWAAQLRAVHMGGAETSSTACLYAMLEKLYMAAVEQVAPGSDKQPQTSHSSHLASTQQFVTRT